MMRQEQSDGRQDTATGQTSADPVLSGRGLACRRGGRTVFEGLDMDLALGEVVILEGPNGSGKSTLLRLLAGLGSATGGHLSLAGMPADRRIQARMLVYLGHATALKSVFTLADNLADFVQMAGHDTPDDDRLVEVCSHFGLTALLDRPVRYFSSGQRRRAALCRFLLVPRSIWLMDEPTVGLDSVSRTALAAMIKTHTDMGGSAVIASHDPLGLDDRVPARTLDLKSYQPASTDPYWTAEPAP